MAALILQSSNIPLLTAPNVVKTYNLSLQLFFNALSALLVTPVQKIADQSGNQITLLKS